MSGTNNSYMSIKNEHNPADLSEKVDNLVSDYKKVLHIIDVEKSNEVTIQNRINELKKSTIQINREIYKLRKNISEIDQRFKNITLMELIAEKKKVLQIINLIIE